MDEREARLSDRELAAVIRKASELQDRAVGIRPDEGTSLTTAKEIASEIGVAPDFVDQAAAKVLDAGRYRIFGGPVRERTTTTLERPLTTDETRELIRRLESVFGRDGHIAASLGSTVWSAGDLALTLTPREQSTDVRISGDRTPSVAPTVMIPLAFGLTAAGAIVDTLQPGGLEALAILTTGAGGGLAVARAVWGASTRSFRARVARIQAEVRRFMTESAPPVVSDNLERRLPSAGSEAAVTEGTRTDRPSPSNP